MPLLIATRRVLLFSGEVSPLLFFDNFDDTEGTLLADHPPVIDNVGNGWTEPDGTSDINSDRLSSKTQPSGWAYAITDIEVASIDIQCLWRNLNDFAYQGPLVFRFQSHTNRWYIDTRPTDNSVAIKKVISGVPTTKDSGTFTHAQNNWYGMRVVIKDDDIAVYCGADLDNLGSTPIASCSGDSSLSSYTKIGTYFNQIDQRIDDFEANLELGAP